MFKRRYKIFAACFGLLLTAFTAYVMLDTFVIARPVTAVSQAAAAETAEVNTADETAGTAQPDSDEQSAETGEETGAGTAETDAAAAETGAASDADAEADSTAAAEEGSESSRKHRKKPGTIGRAHV